MRSLFPAIFPVIPSAASIPIPVDAPVAPDPRGDEEGE
jgi:hypothetical protein